MQPSNLTEGIREGSRLQGRTKVKVSVSAAGSDPASDKLELLRSVSMSRSPDQLPAILYCFK